MDQITGRMLNNNMEFYKLAGIGDIGELVVHMMTGPGYDERGTIGLGEPPVISPGAAISNAVANAIGVRVPTIPLTPDKVLAALRKEGLPSAAFRYPRPRRKVGPNGVRPLGERRSPLRKEGLPNGSL